jgi:hypothetical protein
MESEVVACRRTNNNDNTERRRETTSEKGRAPQRMTSRQLLPPHDNDPKLY